MKPKTWNLNMKPKTWKLGIKFLKPKYETQNRSLFFGKVLQNIKPKTWKLGFKLFKPKFETQKRLWLFLDKRWKTSNLKLET